MAIIALFALTGVAAAKGAAAGIHSGYGRGPGTGFWEWERIVEALSLTWEEIGKLTEVGTAHHNTVQNLRERMRAELEALMEVMESEEYSASSARDQFARSEKLRAEMAQERFSFRLQQRELLGQERYLKLKEISRRAMEKRQGKHHRRRRLEN